jgi:hypothetical protein
MTASEMETNATTRSRVERGRCRLQHLELLEALAGPQHHGLQRRVGDAHRHAGLVSQALVEPAEQGAAAGEHDAAIHDVGGELRGGPVERGLDGVDDGVDGFLDGPADLLRRDRDGLRQTAHEVAPLDLGHELFGHREHARDRELDRLGRALTQQQ